MAVVKSILLGSVALVVFATASSAAWAASQMSDAEYRAELAACKKVAVAKLRDECVSNADNKYEVGKGAEMKSAGEAGKDKTKKMKGAKMPKTDEVMKKSKQKGKKK